MQIQLNWLRVCSLFFLLPRGLADRTFFFFPQQWEQSSSLWVIIFFSEIFFLFSFSDKLLYFFFLSFFFYIVLTSFRYELKRSFSSVALKANGIFDLLDSCVEPGGGPGGSGRRRLAVNPQRFAALEFGAARRLPAAGAPAARRAFAGRRDEELSPRPRGTAGLREPPRWDAEPEPSPPARGAGGCSGGPRGGSAGAGTPGRGDGLGAAAAGGAGLGPPSPPWV